ncbi:unnamed protein product [Mytilus edulis]|uniref:Uncharacterized protein n=1 Tax=Mytilus edulis TaxID=6550 RepID=A0A8S3SQL8_MYTED|nr:unnamed protein product [Mytilus edulis]
MQKRRKNKQFKEKELNAKRYSRKDKNYRKTEAHRKKSQRDNSDIRQIERQRELASKREARKNEDFKKTELAAKREARKNEDFKKTELAAKREARKNEDFKKTELAAKREARKDKNYRRAEAESKKSQRDNPDIRQMERQRETAAKREVRKDTSYRRAEAESKKSQRDNPDIRQMERQRELAAKREEYQLSSSNTDDGPSDKKRRKTTPTSGQTSSGGQGQLSHQSNQETPKDFHEPPIHTAHSIQDDLLEKIKKGTNIMNIAPSDLVDFGGQKSFDMTHQLFIQHRGTFILMFDGRKGLYTVLTEYPQGDVTAASILEHWINSVLTYCNKTEDKMPRILFAATHSDSFSEDEKSKRILKFNEELRKMFSLHKLHEHIMYDNVFFMNATDAADRDIERMKDTLVDIAFQQSTWGQQMPIVWVPLDLQISDMRADGIKLIAKERLLEINKSNNEFALNERRVDDFLLVQHSIGKLLYFDEPALRDFIVIQPTAMVNILRAFITDIMFWPEKGPVRNILEHLSSTGVLKKTDLFTLWSQPAFKEILTDVRTKEYIVQVLLHLDILIEPKRYTDKDTAADLFLVPCIVKEKIPQKMHRNATDDRTICIAYHLKETVVPSALSFKLIGAAISIWPLKVEDSRFCLYFQAAIMDADNRNELQIHVEGRE